MKNITNHTTNSKFERWTSRHLKHVSCAARSYYPKLSAHSEIFSQQHEDMPRVNIIYSIDKKSFTINRPHMWTTNAHELLYTKTRLTRPTSIYLSTKAGKTSNSSSLFSPTFTWSVRHLYLLTGTTFLNMVPTPASTNCVMRRADG